MAILKIERRDCMMIGDGWCCVCVCVDCVRHVSCVSKPTACVSARLSTIGWAGERHRIKLLGAAPAVPSPLPRPSPAHGTGWSAVGCQRG